MTKKLLIEIESHEQVERAVLEVRSLLQHNPAPPFIQTDLTPLLKLLDSLEAALKPFTIECPECGETHDVTSQANNVAYHADRYGEQGDEYAQAEGSFQVTCKCGELIDLDIDVESFVTRVR